MSLLGGRAGTSLSGMPAAPLHAQPVWELRCHRAGHLHWPHGKVVQSEVSGVSLVLEASACTYRLCDLSGPTPLNLSFPIHERKVEMLVCSTQSWGEGRRGLVCEVLDSSWHMLFTLIIYTLRQCPSGRDKAGASHRAV